MKYPAVDYFFIIKSSFEYNLDSDGHKLAQNGESDIWAAGKDENEQNQCSDPAKFPVEDRLNHPKQILAAVDALAEEVGAKLVYLKAGHRNRGVMGLVRFGKRSKKSRKKRKKFFAGVQDLVRRMNKISLERADAWDISPADLMTACSRAVWMHEVVSNVIEGATPNYSGLIVNSNRNRYDIQGLKGGLGGMRDGG